MVMDMHPRKYAVLLKRLRYSMPKVSVVLPSYNGENYISSSIESVCNQSLKDFELIIVEIGRASCRERV